jgi:ketosteroid isomerase-like protein
VCPIVTPEDRAAVERLVFAYCELVDSGDLDGVAGLFERATWRSAGAVVEGRDAVRRRYEPVVLYDDGTPRTKHVVSNLVVEGEGDQATASSYFTVFQATDGFPLQPILAGRYQDTFVRDADGWRFADRLILADLQGDLSRHYPAG